MIFLPIHLNCTRHYRKSQICIAVKMYMPGGRTGRERGTYPSARTCREKGHFGVLQSATWGGLDPVARFSVNDRSRVASFFPRKAGTGGALTMNQPSARLPLMLHTAAEQTPEGDTMTPVQPARQRYGGGILHKTVGANLPVSECLCQRETQKLQVIGQGFSI